MPPHRIEYKIFSFRWFFLIFCFCENWPEAKISIIVIIPFPFVAPLHIAFANRKMPFDFGFSFRRFVNFNFRLSFVTARLIRECVKFHHHHQVLTRNSNSISMRYSYSFSFTCGSTRASWTEGARIITIIDGRVIKCHDNCSHYDCCLSAWCSNCKLRVDCTTEFLFSHLVAVSHMIRRRTDGVPVRMTGTWCMQRQFFCQTNCHFNHWLNGPCTKSSSDIKRSVSQSLVDGVANSIA